MAKSVQIKVEGQLDPKGFDQAQKKLDALAKSAEGNIDKMKAGFKSAGENVVEFGNKVNKALLIGAGGIAAGLAFSVKQFANFDEALTKSTAIMGDVSDVMRKEMSDAAREVAKTTAFSATEAAESYFFLASAGLDAAASIAALPQVAAFAQAGAFDMARATDLLTDAQSALGLSSKDAAENLENMSRVSDVLVKANTMANASVEQFSEALTNKAGAAMRALGMEVEEGVAVLAVFADQGLKGSAAGVALNATLEGLTRTARNNTAQYEALGVSVFDSSGEMRNMADIVADLEVALSGMSTEQQLAELASLGLTRQAMDGTKMLLGNSEAIREYEESLRSSSGFTEDVAAKQMETFNAQLGLLKDRFLDVALGIGERLMPHIMKFAEFVGDKVVPAVEQLAEKAIAKVQELFETWAPRIERVVRVLQDKLQPIIERVLGFLKDNTDVVRVFFGVLAGAVALASIAALAAKLAILFNPIGLIIVGVAALAAGIVWAYKRFEVFRNVVDAVGRFFRGFARLIMNNMDTIKAVVGAVLGFVMEYFKFVFGVAKVVVQTLFQVFKGVFNGIMLVARPIFNFIVDNWETISAVAQAVIEGIGTVFRTVWAALQVAMNVLSTVIQTAWRVIRAVVEPIINAIRIYFEVAWALIRTAMSVTQAVIEAAWRAIRAVVEPIINTLRSVFETAFGIIQTVMRTTRDVINTAWERVKEIVEPIIDGIKTVFETAFGIIQTTAETVRDVITGAWTTIKDSAQSAFGAISGFMVSAMNGVIGAVESGINAVLAGVRSLGRILRAVGVPFPDISNVSLPRVGQSGAASGGGGGGGVSAMAAAAMSADFGSRPDSLFRGGAGLAAFAASRAGVQFTPKGSVVIENYNTFSKVDDQMLLKMIEFEVAGGRL